MSEWRASVLDFLKKRQANIVELPKALQPENPVNYNSVLDYLTGLSKADYAKMVKSAEIYRDANAKVAKVVGVKDEPTTQLITPKPDDEELDSALDQLLETDPEDLKASIIADKTEEPKKAQAPSKQTKITVKD